MLAAGLAARAVPDGYTLLFVSPEFAVNPSLQTSVPYDVHKDFAPIVHISAYEADAFIQTLKPDL